MRVIQQGSGATRNVLVGFYCQASIHEMAVAVPDALVLSVDTTRATLDRRMLLEQVEKLGGSAIGEVALIGWSAGCHGVRDVLDELYPDVVIALDGTHGSIPQPGNMPIDPWRKLAGMARRKETLWISSHIFQTYTERLKITDTNKTPAFLCTATVMRDVTGWPLPEPPGEAPFVRRDGDLVVYSWASGDCDGAAHTRQVRDVGPMLVRDWIAPRWLGDAAPPASPATLYGLIASSADGWATPAGGSGGAPTPPAAPPATGPGHGWRCSVYELTQDGKSRGRWRSAGDVRAGRYRPRVGDLIVSARAGQEPEVGGAGHVERVTRWADDGTMWTIGGNESNTWVEAPYDIANTLFRGVLEVDPEIGEHAVGFARAELRAKVHETAGPAATTRIQEYHAGARRGGSPLAGMPGHEGEGDATLGEHASDEIPWCASSACWCEYQAIAA